MWTQLSTRNWTSSQPSKLYHYQGETLYSSNHKQLLLTKAPPLTLLLPMWLSCQLESQMSQTQILHTRNIETFALHWNAHKSDSSRKSHDAIWANNSLQCKCVCVCNVCVCVFVRVLAVTPAAQFHLSAAATRSHDILRSGKELMPDRREQLN